MLLTEVVNILSIVIFSTSQVSAEGGKVSRVKKGIKSLVSNKKVKVATGVIVIVAVCYYFHAKYSAKLEGSKIKPEDLETMPKKNPELKNNANKTAETEEQRIQRIQEIIRKLNGYSKVQVLE